jgi:NAD(P)-dependent dehydrogenase (short-subunit alcohol dehydrogenase family)
MKGQVVLITGASRGFGAAAARRIAGRGNTIIAAMRDPLRDGAQVVAGYERSIHPVQLDVTDDRAVEAVVDAVVHRFGRVDVLINNAGYGLYGPIEDAAEDEIWRQVDTNVFGQWRLCRAVLPHMRRAGRGKIVNVSSTAGRISGPLLGMYSASKHAVEAMTEALRFEVGNLGIQVCALEPGMFRSDWQTTNLDVVAAVRDGRSPYQAAVERQLGEFRATAATRPGATSVAAALADIVELEQRLPMRWPVGNDATHMLPLHKKSSDEEWQQLRQSGVLGYWRKAMWLPDEILAPAPGLNWSTGNVVLITGASRGFGEAAAREIAERGNTVIATMRNPGRDAAGVIRGFEDRIHPVALDVTDGAAVERAVADAIARFGHIDAVINNAGYGLYGPVEDFTSDEVRRQFDTNFLGQWRLCKAVLPHMRARRRGKLISVSSLSGQVPSPMMAFYAASKHAVEAMSEALAAELLPWGIQVSILEPGMYRSDWQTTNLDVAERVRDGQSPYQRGVERQLAGFRALARTRPGSDAVAAAMADMVELHQPLPMRWMIGDDCVRMIQRRRALPDDDWERELRAAGWGFTRDEVD